MLVKIPQKSSTSVLDNHAELDTISDAQAVVTNVVPEQCIDKTTNDADKDGGNSEMISGEPNSYVEKVNVDYSSVQDFSDGAVLSTGNDRGIAIWITLKMYLRTV